MSLNSWRLSLGWKVHNLKARSQPWRLNASCELNSTHMQNILNAQQLDTSKRVKSEIYFWKRDVTKWVTKQWRKKVNNLVSKVNDNKKYNGFGYIGCNGYVPCQVRIHNKYSTCKRVQQIVQKFRNALFHARARFLLENCNNLVLISHLCKLFTIFLSCFQTRYSAIMIFMQDNQ